MNKSTENLEDLFREKTKQINLQKNKIFMKVRNKLWSHIESTIRDISHQIDDLIDQNFRDIKFSVEKYKDSLKISGTGMFESTDFRAKEQSCRQNDEIDSSNTSCSDKGMKSSDRLRSE